MTMSLLLSDKAIQPPVVHFHHTAGVIVRRGGDHRKTRKDDAHQTQPRAGQADETARQRGAPRPTQGGES